MEKNQAPLLYRNRASGSWQSADSEVVWLVFDPLHTSMIPTLDIAQSSARACKQ